MGKSRLSPYEKTLARAEKKNIIIDQTHESTAIPAAGIRFGGDMGIFINEKIFETDTDRRLAFTHEMAHCETNGFYNERTHESDRGKIEYTADKRTVTDLVSFKKYEKTLLSGCFSEYEQAEAWDVPQYYVCIVHRIYEQTRWDDVQHLKARVSEAWGDMCI
jgi:hypothetical protein